MDAFRHGLVGYLAECAASIRRTFQAHIPLYVCLVLFNLITAAIAETHHAPLDIGSTWLFIGGVTRFFLVGAFIAMLVQYARLAMKKSGRPLREFGMWVRRATLDGDRPGNAFHTLMTVAPLMISFNALKEDIPLIDPFTWDKTFMEWDWVLGFGRQPWEWLQPIMGYPLVTSAVSFAYEFWFFLMFGTLIWQAFFVRGSQLRMQYLLAFAMSWFIAGNILAVIFASAGPCFYGHLYQPDPYAGLMAYLREANRHWTVITVAAQDFVWGTYGGGRSANFGISAMPSMHVVSSVVMTLLVWRTNRLVGLGFALFTFVILIGSVHLGWHYLVDGIAGVMLAFAFWSVAGLIVRSRFATFALAGDQSRALGIQTRA